MSDERPFDDEQGNSGIEFDAYGFKGKLNPAARQADEPANWWGVLAQLNLMLMDFVVHAPGVAVDTVKGLRNVVRAIGGVRTVPRDVKQIARAAQDKAERSEIERESRASSASIADSGGADEALLQVLRELQADGLHVEIIERADGAMAIVLVRPEPEWQEKARKIAGYVAEPDETKVKSLHEIGLPARIIQRLEAADLISVGELASLKDEELLKIEGIGRKSLEIIRQCLQKIGF